MPDVDRLLALANGAALHKALVKRGVAVSYRTVARWIGAQPQLKPPAEMVDPILQAFGVGEIETAPAWWAEAAEALVDQIEERMMPTNGELAVPEDLVRAVAQSLADELGLSQPLDDEDTAADTPASQGAGRRAAKRQR